MLEMTLQYRMLDRPQEREKVLEGGHTLQVEMVYFHCTLTERLHGREGV